MRVVDGVLTCCWIARLDARQLLASFLVCVRLYRQEMYKFIGCDAKSPFAPYQWPCLTFASNSAGV